MLKRIFSGFFLLFIAIILISWGSNGHSKISNNASLSFFQQMAQFNSWTSYLVAHASDADDRKATDPTESPKHYIDIDMYADFNTSHHILQTWDSIVAQNGAIWVNENGILPWTTLATYDSLKNAFLHYNWTKAMFFAADLGHYVADGYMPLHITKNYDGQNSGNSGIHSRYESTMISGFETQITYTGDTVKLIPNVNHYVFNYLYTNYTYIDSVLAADDYAYGLSTNYYSTTYKNALWSKSQKFTKLLFKNASHALAELIYNAWVEAGSPTLGTSSISTNPSSGNYFLEQNSPNPFQTSTQINFTLDANSPDVSLKIMDFHGKIVSILLQGTKAAGTYTIEWTPKDLPSGIYFCELANGNTIQVKKMVYLR